MAQSSDTTDRLPELITYPATSEDDKISALRLVADSVAQQRQIAAGSIISHPLSIASVVLLIAVVGKYQYKGDSLGELAFLGTTGAGCLMILLALVQWMTGGYLEEAGRVGTWKWLESKKSLSSSTTAKGQTEEDVFLVTKYGDQIIGTILLHFSSSTSKAKKQPVLVRAWTVVRRYRYRGLGAELLAQALAYVNSRQYSAADLQFDEHHANSLRILPAMFNKRFEKREGWARTKLEKVKVVEGYVKNVEEKK